jgi:hypothetical protein
VESIVVGTAATLDSKDACSGSLGNTDGSLTVEHTMQFYRKHDDSKADRETAEYILSTYSTEEVLKNFMDRYGEVPGSAVPSSGLWGLQHLYQKPPSSRLFLLFVLFS